LPATFPAPTPRACYPRAAAVCETLGCLAPHMRAAAQPSQPHSYALLAGTYLPLRGHTPGKFPGKKRALSRTVYVYNTCLDGFLECIGTRRARYLKATSCDQHSTARANVWSCGAVCAVHAWSFTRSRSRFLSSRWQCRPHTCSPALAGRRGLGRHLMRSSVICGPLRSRWRRRRVSTLDSRRRRQVAACGQPQVA
jgi:hypothetical protein